MMIVDVVFLFVHVFLKPSDRERGQRGRSQARDHIGTGAGKEMSASA